RGAGGLFFFSSRRRHTRWPRDWSSDVCSSDLQSQGHPGADPAQSRPVDPLWVDALPALALLRLGQAPELDEGRETDDAGLRRPKIGRASCRERGESWGVAVRLKTNSVTVIGGR